MSLLPETKAATVADPGFRLLLDRLLADRPADAERRALAFQRFTRLGVPTERAESWRYSRVGALANRAHDPAPPPVADPALVASLAAGGAEATRLVLVGGRLAPVAGQVRPLPAGMRVTTLAALRATDPSALRGALARLDDDERSFTALNTALAEDGVWIELEDGVQATAPVHLMFLAVGGDTPVLANPRCIVSLGAGAKLHLLETHAGAEAGQSLTNLVWQISLGEGAALVHDRLQILPAGAALLAKSVVDLAGQARLDQTTATLGGRLVRNETEAHVRGRAVECRLNGAFLASGTDQADTVIRIHHEAAGSHSDQFFKGVADQRGRGAFQGKIIVAVDAQQTNAFQTNNNLLLSDEAELDTKPELEIYADDVKCSHGATCGDLDPQALFYLRSRGVGLDNARSILTYAFLAEALDRLADPDLRAQARAAAASRLPGGAILQEIA